jgi:hypothetical protein
MRTLFGRPIGVAGLAGLLAAGPAWAGAKLKTLHELNGNQDGSSPMGGLALDEAGNLFGTSQFGGKYDCGVVFELSRNAGGGWTFTTIYDLTGNEDGAFPSGSPTFDSKGNLYITSILGTQVSPYGAVFQLVPGKNQHWKLGLTHVFNGAGSTGNNGDGAKPLSGVTVDSAGRVFGTAVSGGAEGKSLYPYGYGTVFELIPSDQGWTEKTLRRFEGGAYGAYPTGGLIIDKNGDLYGTTPYGGVNATSAGIVFRLRKEKAEWKETIIHSFNYPSEGNGPQGNLLFDSAGNIYGTTNIYAGTVFKLTRPAAGTSDTQEWPLTTLYQYPSGLGTVGLVFDKEGNLYSLGAGNGTYFDGTVSKFSPSASGAWKMTVMWNFTGGRDGSDPFGTLVLYRDQTLFGTSVYGGTGGFEGNGVVFAVAK